MNKPILEWIISSGVLTNRMQRIRIVYIFRVILSDMLDIYYNLFNEWDNG
jgi:hypothetical protein